MLNAASPADRALHAFFRAHAHFGQRDRAFIAETAFGALRHRRVLEALLPRVTPHLLVLGTLARFEGWSAQRLAPYAEHGDLELMAQLKAGRLEDLPLAVRAELPDWVVTRLEATHDADAILALGRALAAQAPLDLRVNTMSATRETVLAQLAAEGVPAQATPHSPLGVRVPARTALQKHPLFLGGKVEVQDEGSQLLCLLVAPRRGELVIDFCAGAGGKTLALGALMQSHGRVYAYDVSASRIEKLGPRLRRSGLSNVHPQVISSENDIRIKRLAGKADRVLVDAPCSGLGTLRRNPDLKWRMQESGIAELAEKQARLLAAAARLVKPGGRLVYATCSILGEENEAIADTFAAAHPEFKPVACNDILAMQRVALDTGPYFKLSPAVHGTDGFFAAVFERAKAS
ncbi:MAG: RsmB/NOP family class I SAM-dependent RNA methyltransferase [Burkholderiales bacterium]